MKKIFTADYGTDLAKEVADWIIKQTLTEDGSCEIFRPTIVVELFDQNGHLVDQK